MTSGIVATQRAGTEPAAGDSTAGTGYLLPLLVVVLATIPKLWFLTAPSDSMDESILLVYPELLAQGALPNRDFFTVYGPGTYAMLTGLYAVTGVSVIAERIVGLTVQALIVVGVMKLTRPCGSRADITAGVVSAILLTGPMMFANAWNSGLALTVWSIVLLQGEQRSSAFVAGLFGGLSTFWRFEMLVAQIAALPMIWRDRRALPYVVGFAFGLVPTLVHLSLAGRVVFENVVLERLGVPSQRSGDVLTSGTVALVGLLLLSTVILAVVTIRSRSRYDASLVLLALLLLPQALQRVDHFHVVAAGGVVIPLALAALLRELPVSSPAQPALRYTAAAGILSLTLALSAAFAAARVPTQAVTHGGRTIYLTPAHAAAIEQYVAAAGAHVPSGATLFVGARDMSIPVANLIYLYALLPEYNVDAYYVEIPEGVANVAGSKLVSDVERADALILTDTPPDLGLDTATSGLGTQDANRVVAASYCVAARLPEGELLLRNGAC